MCDGVQEGLNDDTMCDILRRNEVTVTDLKRGTSQGTVQRPKTEAKTSYLGLAPVPVSALCRESSRDRVRRDEKSGNPEISDAEGKASN